MMSGINSSLVGLQNASKRIETAAANIAKTNASPTPENGAIPSDPTRDIIDLSVAAHDFKANAKVIEVQNKVEQSLLDILA